MAAGTGGPADRLMTAVSCLAVEPGLTGLLLFDLDADSLLALGRWLARRTGPQHSAARPVVVLPAHPSEEQLWSAVRLRPRHGRFVVTTHLGPLVDADPARPPPVVVVPDLAQLGPTAARAVVALAGADVAHLERPEASVTWRPRATWLAQCPREAVRRVSRHLLDRLPLRVDAAGLRVVDPAAGPSTEPRAARLVLPLPAAWPLPPPADPPPRLTTEAVHRVVDRCGGLVAGSRRDLALARAARALAVLRAAAVVTPELVDRAADLFVGPPRTARLAPAAEPPDGEPSGSEPAPPPVADRAVVLSDSRNLDGRDVAATSLPGPLHPEDVSDRARGLAAPHVPWRRPHRTWASGGSTGTAPARDDLTDVAVTATLLQAARFQRVRPAAPDGGLLVAPTDLRIHSRPPARGRRLVLVLDHTCHRGWDWHPTLNPYLRWAYVHRAGVCVIEVGGHGARHELRAESYTARSLLDPRLPASLRRPAGTATPLAHGLTLAAEALRGGPAQGVHDAWLVLATDGRANVPLAASTEGIIAGPVGARGLTDALAVAATIRRYDWVEAVVAHPDGRPGRGLAAALADALGARLVTGRAGGDPAAEQVHHG